MNRVTGTDVNWVWYQMPLIPILGNASFKLREIRLPLPPNAWTIKYTGIWDLDEKQNILSECTKPWVWSLRPPKQQQCRSVCIIQGAKTLRYLKAQKWKKLECFVWLLNWVPGGATWDNYRILIPKSSAFSSQTPHTCPITRTKESIPRGSYSSPTTPKVNA